MGATTTQAILKDGIEEYKKTHNIPHYKHRAINALIKCRTAALGGHKQYCPNGCVERIWYNSCKHRFCPLCCFIRVERWLLKQKARLLKCDYYHAIFTIPHELNIIWLYNESLLTTLLFSSVKEVLFELLSDSEHLGAKPGIIATFQTWSQTLLLHPHIHCLITGGGLTCLGQWKSIKNGYLLPFRLVAARFRIKFINSLRKALDKGKVVLPPDMSYQKFQNLLNKLKFKKKKWNVNLSERYGHGAGVATYLARYLKGGPISNSRIISCDGKKVTFYYRENSKEDKKGKRQTMSLPFNQFIDRLLLHVPKHRAIMVRSWGLFAHCRKDDLALCREQLGQLPEEDVKFLDWQTLCSKRGIEHPEKCPVCGCLLRCSETFGPDRIPDGIPPPVRLMEKKT
jgi:hypothetical protein